MTANFPSSSSYGFNVRRAHRAFDRLLHSYLTPHGIKTGYWYYLRALWETDGLTQKEMSDLNNVSENTTAILIGGMVKDRLVTRARHQKDKRKWIVSLTPRAARLRAELGPYAMHVNELAAAGIPKKDLVTCLSVLKRMSSNLEQILKRVEPGAGDG